MPGESTKKLICGKCNVLFRQWNFGEIKNYEADIPVWNYCYISISSDVAASLLKVYSRISLKVPRIEQFSSSLQCSQGS